MSRPFERVGIVDLENLCLKNIGNVPVLESLIHELSYRNTQRAASLLSKVQRLLNPSAPASGNVPPSKSLTYSAGLELPKVPVFSGMKQAELPPAPVWERPKPVPRLKPASSSAATPAVRVKAVQPRETNAASSTSLSAFAPVSVGTVSTPSTPSPGSTGHTIKPEQADILSAMPIEQAYRLLKVGVNSAWEEVEASRRELVGRSRPDKLSGLLPAQRQAAQDEARLINLAYQRLLKERIA